MTWQRYAEFVDLHIRTVGIGHARILWVLHNKRGAVHSGWVESSCYEASRTKIRTAPIRDTGRG